MKSDADRKHRSEPIRPGDHIRWRYHQLAQGYAYVLAEVRAIHDDYVLVEDRDEIYRLERDVWMERVA